MLESEALRRNLEETHVAEIVIDTRYEILFEAFKDYQGVLRTARHLVEELHHPFLNWDVIIDELRSFALKNLTIIQRSNVSLQAIEVLIQTFIDISTNAPKDRSKAKSIDSLLAFIEKLLQSHFDIKQLSICLSSAFKAMLEMSDVIHKAIARSLHPLPKIIEQITRLGETAGIQSEVHIQMLEDAIILLKTVTLKELGYWLEVEDSQNWVVSTINANHIQISADELGEITQMLLPFSHEELRREKNKIETLTTSPPIDQRIQTLCHAKGHIEIVRHYRWLAQTFAQRYCRLPGGHVEDGEIAQADLHLLFLFHLLEIDALESIHEEVLRQINRRLICLVKEAQLGSLQKALPKSFVLLKQHMGNFPQTALQSIEALGAEIFKLNNERLLELFLELVVEFGFQSPEVKGVDVEWHVLSNPAHLQNVRVWLKLICQNPRICRTLLSALVVNISLAGTCIKDTDLFQKDITNLLNSDIESAYNIVKQFAKVLPVYYNEIGAEGLLRDVSTELDELCKRQDKLIHFLRKQCHVESNNLIVDFIEAIICFWQAGDKSVLSPFVPQVALEKVDASGQFFDEVHKIMKHIADRLSVSLLCRDMDRLLNLPEDRLLSLINEVEAVSERERQRVALLVRMLRLETMKYRLGTQEALQHLNEAKAWGFSELSKVIEAIYKDDPEECLEVILSELERLKEVILSSERFEVREDIYYKRHIAVDIPSVYGRYHERKFDALSLTFRLEGLANLYFERLVQGLDVNFVTKATFMRITKCLLLFKRALTINGLFSRTFSTHLTLLEQSVNVRRFSFSQYLDIVRGLSEGVKDIINVYYISAHQEVLSRVLKQLGTEKLLLKYRKVAKETQNHGEFFHQVAERFYREQISMTLGLQCLDNFISKIYQVLGEQKDILSQKDLDLLLSYDPDRILCFIHNPPRQTKDLIHLGNKGYNLVMLAREGLPVPAGAIVTTELFRCYPVVQKFPNVYRDFRSQLADCIKKIEQMTPNRYGDPASPLLLSVRSGAAISMPGMMATIINVGSNLATIEGLANKTGNAWFAWDNYRRFIQSWAMAFGMERDVFSALMREQKQKYGVEKKREFTGEQMKELAMLYRKKVLDSGFEIEDEPMEQLVTAIRIVLNSWDAPKAGVYRNIMEVSDYWGTAVIVQAMAYGNISEDAGTGVVFTANPLKKLDRLCLWGDFTPGNQGEDIVSGLVSTFPISTEQKEVSGLNSDFSLEEYSPEIYEALLDVAKKLIYEKKWSPQEIEFTFEGSKKENLFILQTRNMATKKRETVNVFAPSDDLKDSILGRGVGVSGGALCGKAVFNFEEVLKYRRLDPSVPLILVRSDTVPEDIQEISAADGLLTARGGQTSHASIVAFRLDKVCVVGCKALQVLEEESRAILNDREIRCGDFIGIDGRKGIVYAGWHEVQPERRLVWF